MAGTMGMNPWTKSFHCLVTGLRCLLPHRTTGPVRVRSVFHPWLQNASGSAVVANEGTHCVPGVARSHPRQRRCLGMHSAPVHPDLVPQCDRMGDELPDVDVGPVMKSPREIARLGRRRAFKEMRNKNRPP